MNNPDIQAAAAYAAAIVLAYLVGSIPFGLLIGRFYHIDIRKHGSGNIGATNVTRVVGKWAGRICFFCDFLKGGLPVLAVHWFWRGQASASLLAIGVALAAVLGHLFPVFLKFRGGKGVSTAAGAALALAPLPLLTAAVVWAALFFSFGYVSLASIGAAVALPVAAAIFLLFKIGGNVACSGSTLIFFVVVAALATLRHRENIRRLLNGTESRFRK